MNIIEEICTYFPAVKKFRLDLTAGVYAPGTTLFLYHMDGCFQDDLCAYLSMTLGGVYLNFLTVAKETHEAIESIKMTTWPFVIVNDESNTDILYQTIKKFTGDTVLIVSRDLHSHHPVGLGLELTWPCRKEHAIATKAIMESECAFTPDKSCCDALWDVTSGCPEMTSTLIRSYGNTKSKRTFLMNIVETNATTKKQTLTLYNNIVNREVPLEDIGKQLRKFLEGHSWRQGSLYLTRELTNDILDNPAFAVSIGLTQLLAKPISSEAHFAAFCLDLANKVREKSYA